MLDLELEYGLSVKRQIEGKTQELWKGDGDKGGYVAVDLSVADADETIRAAP